jgi:G3E family GTPase
VRSNLVGTLNSLYHARQAGEIPDFDNVVIETSGLAEPGAVLQAFLSEPTLDGLYRVASVLTLVDAVNWAGAAHEHDEAVRQAALADQIRITKSDLVSQDHDERLGQVRQDLARLNPAANIEPVDFTSATVAKLLSTRGFDAADPSADPRPWLNADTYAHAAEACEHHEHDHPHHHAHSLVERGIESFVLVREAPMAREELQFLLDGVSQNLGPGLLRVKGLVNVAEETGRPAVIQGAQHLLHTMTWLDRWPDADERTRVVFITQGIARSNLTDIIELLDRVSARTYKARAKGRAAMAASKTTPQTP